MTDDKPNMDEETLLARCANEALRAKRYEPEMEAIGEFFRQIAGMDEERGSDGPYSRLQSSGISSAMAWGGEKG